MQNTGHDEHTVGTEDLKQTIALECGLKQFRMLWSTSLHYNYFKEGQYLKQNKNKKTPMTLCRNNTIHSETHILFLLVFLQVQIAQSKFCQSTRDGRPNKEFTIQKILTQRRSVGKQQIERFSYLYSIITKALILFSLSLKLRKILSF